MTEEVTEGVMRDELRSILEMQRIAEEAHINFLESVSAAKKAGVTWQQIGDIMGISRQAAWERFHDIV